MTPTDKANADYIRAQHIAEAEIEIDKWSVDYEENDGDVKVNDFACVVAGLILFERRFDLYEFDSALYERARAQAKEIAEELNWSEKRERRAMERYYNKTR